MQMSPLEAAASPLEQLAQKMDAPGINASNVPQRCARSGSLSQVVLLVSEAAGKSTKADGLSGCAEGALGIFLNRLLFLGLQHFFRAISYNLHDPHR